MFGRAQLISVVHLGLDDIVDKVRTVIQRLEGSIYIPRPELFQAGVQ